MNFKLEIELGNDAMRTGPDVAAALRDVAYKLDHPTHPIWEMRIADTNGNTVGSFERIASELPYDSDAYRWRMELLGKIYEPKALALLERIKEVVEGAGFFAGSPADMGCEESMWSLPVWRTEEAINNDALAERDAIDITVKLCEQRQYEGGDDFGVNFMIDIVEHGGRILGGLSPYNYTPDVWVDGKDEQAVEERWQLLADADIHEIPKLLGADDKGDEKCSNN